MRLSMLHGGLWPDLSSSETADVPTQPHRVYREWKKKKKIPSKEKKREKKIYSKEQFSR